MVTATAGGPRSRPWLWHCPSWPCRASCCRCSALPSRRERARCESCCWVSSSMPRPDRSAPMLTMTGHERQAAVVMGVAAIGQIALSVALIPRFGAEGAAVANALSLIGWNLAMAVAGLEEAQDRAEHPRAALTRFAPARPKARISALFGFVWQNRPPAAGRARHAAVAVVGLGMAGPLRRERAACADPAHGALGSPHGADPISASARPKSQDFCALWVRLAESASGGRPGPSCRRRGRRLGHGGAFCGANARLPRVRRMAPDPPEPPGRVRARSSVLAAFVRWAFGWSWRTRAVPQPPGTRRDIYISRRRKKCKDQRALRRRTVGQASAASSRGSPGFRAYL